jgi:Zn-dependent protease with chaperone function
MLVYAVVVVGWYSRLLEHDADLDACQTERGHFEPAAADHFSQALITLYGRSSESRLGEWLHPSLRQRLEVIRRAADEPAFAAAFRRRLWWIAATIVAAHLTALAAVAWMQV